MTDVEFPITHDGVTLEQDDGGIWITVEPDKPRWLGPKALAALRVAGVVSEEPEWEYGSEGEEGSEDGDPRPLTDDQPYWPQDIHTHAPNAEQGARIVAAWNEGDPNSARLIRRRKAGPWELVTP